jgi:DNA-binding CsgD family transcriptional regulator
MLELIDGSGRRLVELTGSHASVGKSASNDVVIADPTVSDLHALLERIAEIWTVRDLGSRNGTFLNRERIFSAAVLRPGDELRFGAAIAFYRGAAPAARVPTAPVAVAPTLTPRERDVLIELCRPLRNGDVFCDPATPREIAAALTVSEDAVKKHLSRLYEKFEILENGGRRRVRLANLALTTGVIGLGDLGVTGDNGN